MGMFIGLIPSLTLNILLILFIILLNVNIGSALLAILLFRALAFILDPILNLIGYMMLVRVAFLENLWTFLYDLPFLAYTGFNNTVVMGSIIAAFVFSAPVYTLSRRGFMLYRKRYAERINKFPLIKAIRASFIYDVYRRLKQLGEQLWK